MAEMEKRFALVELIWPWPIGRQWLTCTDEIKPIDSVFLFIVAFLSPLPWRLVQLSSFNSFPVACSTLWFWFGREFITLLIGAILRKIFSYISGNQSNTSATPDKSFVQQFLQVSQQSAVWTLLLVRLAHTRFVLRVCRHFFRLFLFVFSLSKYRNVVAEW